MAKCTSMLLCQCLHLTASHVVLRCAAYLIVKPILDHVLVGCPHTATEHKCVCICSIHKYVYCRLRRCSIPLPILAIAVSSLKHDLAGLERWPCQCSAEVAMADGTVQAAALKKVAYSHPVHQYAFNAELAALRDAEGCPHLGQCIAVFKHEDKNEGGSCLSILLE